jgi:methionine-S-sulfoxide reductase
MQKKFKKATLAGGCFWCTEAIFKRIKGVKKVTSGYTGGNIENPSYEQVSSSSTGHAEAIQITYAPNVISYDDLLYIFFRTHDPTTLNRQGADVGTQYRSAIFYHNETQKKKAEKALKEAQRQYESKIVTEIVPFKKFYKAEDYHKDYYKNHTDAAYCKLVIDPKIKKLQDNLSKYLK